MGGSGYARLQLHDVYFLLDLSRNIIGHVIGYYFTIPGFYLEIFVWGGSSDEGKADHSGGLGVHPQKVLNVRSPETQFKAI